MKAKPGFGDRVRIRYTPETARRGFVDREGTLYGWSKPSSSRVGPVIGTRGDEHFALSVYFDDTGEQEWFAPDLVEFVARGEGTLELAPFRAPKRSQ